MNKSFTLIEILVVIVIIGILSAFILVGMSSITSSANIAKGKAFLNSMDNSLLLSRVSEWKLENSSGTDSWSGKTATLVNSPTLTPNCAQDSCYTFNGTSQYAWVADDPVFNFGSYMSAFVWVKGSDTAAIDYIFGQYDAGTNKMSWAIIYDSTYLGKLRINLSDDGTWTSGHRKAYVTTSANIIDGNWHLAGFTWNSGTFKLYVDGVEAAVTKYLDDAITILYNSDANLTIGCALNSGSPVQLFTGSIDDARLYNQAIPTSEIQQNYFVGINKLFNDNGIALNEFSQRLVELKSNIANNE